MTRRGYLHVTGLVAGLFVGLFTVVALLAPHPRLIWNASASEPIGFYRVTPGEQPGRGDLVVIEPPARLAHFLAERRYLPVGVPLLKHVAAAPGARVCRHGDVVTIDGARKAVARPRDRLGRVLPTWQGCRIVGRSELFLRTSAGNGQAVRLFLGDDFLLGADQVDAMSVIPNLTIHRFERMEPTQDGYRTRNRRAGMRLVG